MHFAYQRKRILCMFEDLGAEHVIEAFVGKRDLEAIEGDDIGVSAHSEIVSRGNIDAGVAMAGQQEAAERHFSAADIKHATCHTSQMWTQESRAREQLQVENHTKREAELADHARVTPDRNRLHLLGDRCLARRFVSGLS
jgi:hypothetical protein